MVTLLIVSRGTLNRPEQNEPSSRLGHPHRLTPNETCSAQILLDVLRTSEQTDKAHIRPNPAGDIGPSYRTTNDRVPLSGQSLYPARQHGQIWQLPGSLGQKN